MKRDLIGKKPMVYYAGKPIQKSHPDLEPYSKPAIKLQTTILEKLKNRTIYSPGPSLIKSAVLHFLLQSFRIP